MVDGSSSCSRPRRRHRSGGSRSSVRSTITRLAVGPSRRRSRPEHQRVGPPAATSARTARPAPHPRRAARRRRATSTRSTSSRTTSSPANRCPPARSTRSSPPGDARTCSSPATPPTASSTSASRATRAARRRGRDRRRRPHRPRAAPGGSRAATTGSTACTRPRSGASGTTPATCPTDCPQRERAGWTGDWQIFSPTAAFLYDVAGFTARWLRDLAADQWPDGRVPNFVPDPPGPRPTSTRSPAYLTGSAGWGDAAVLVPWEMWLPTATIDCSPSSVDSMVRVGRVRRRHAPGRPPHVPGRRRARARAPRDLPLGHWVPLGRVV